MRSILLVEYSAQRCTDDCEMLGMRQCLCGCDLWFCAVHRVSSYWVDEDHMLKYWLTRYPLSRLQYFAPYFGASLAAEIDEMLEDRVAC